MSTAILSLVLLAVAFVPGKANAQAGGVGGGDLFIISKVLDVKQALKKDIKSMGIDILGKNDFEVFQASINNPIQFFSGSEMPSNVYFHEDYSGYSLKRSEFHKENFPSIFFLRQEWPETLDLFKKESYLLKLICVMNSFKDCQTRADLFYERMIQLHPHDQFLTVDPKKVKHSEEEFEQLMDKLFNTLKIQLVAKTNIYTKDQWDRLNFVLKNRITFYYFPNKPEIPIISALSVFHAPFYPDNEDEAVHVIFFNGNDPGIYEYSDLEYLALLHHELCVMAGIEASGLYDLTFSYLMQSKGLQP